MRIMPKKKKVKFTREELLRKGFPVALVTGILLLSSLGINKLSDLKKIDDYQKWSAKHPFSAVISKIVDGDTFEIKNGGVTVRLLGIDAPNRGEKGDKEAIMALTKIIEGKQIWLEYDRYQDDKYNRLLAWVWIGCESRPKFLSYDYMHLSYNQSRPGLSKNPEGCLTGKLVNEEMIKKGLAVVDVFKDRGELKYEERLRKRDGVTR